jgi:hypothetical protein
VIWIVFAIKSVFIDYFTQAFRKTIRTLEQNCSKSLQKHGDAFTRTWRRFAEGIVMKNQKARKQLENRLQKAPNSAKTTISTCCFY